MKTFTVTSAWHGTGTDDRANGYGAQIQADYPPVWHAPVAPTYDAQGNQLTAGVAGYFTGVYACSRVDPINPAAACTFRCECDDATFTAVQADPKYSATAKEIAAAMP